LYNTSIFNIIFVYTVNINNAIHYRDMIRIRHWMEQSAGDLCRAMGYFFSVYYYWFFICIFYLFILCIITLVFVPTHFCGTSGDLRIHVRASSMWLVKMFSGTKHAVDRKSKWLDTYPCSDGMILIPRVSYTNSKINSMCLYIYSYGLVTR